jgi:hypothetical protein
MALETFGAAVSPWENPIRRAKGSAERPRGDCGHTAAGFTVESRGYEVAITKGDSLAAFLIQARPAPARCAHRGLDHRPPGSGPSS